jgi:hypothetical protein
MESNLGNSLPPWKLKPFKSKPKSHFEKTLMVKYVSGRRKRFEVDGYETEFFNSSQSYTCKGFYRKNSQINPLFIQIVY